MHLVDVEIEPSLAILDEGVVLPCVPQPQHHIGEFARPRITLGGRRMGGAAETVGLGGRGRGHEVPAGPAAADLVQRREQARDVIGFDEAGGEGRHQADVPCQDRQRGEHGHRLDAGNRAAALPDLRIIRPEGDKTIREEDHVEPPGFPQPRNFSVMRKGLAGVIGYGGVPPGRHVMTAPLNEKTQFHHPQAPLVADIPAPRNGR